MDKMTFDGVQEYGYITAVYSPNVSDHGSMRCEPQRGMGPGQIWQVLIC
jgi:hypothetical protein